MNTADNTKLHIKKISRPRAPSQGPLIGSTYLGFSLNIEATGSRVPHESLVKSHAAFMPDAAWAEIRPPPRLFPG